MGTGLRNKRRVVRFLKIFLDLKFTMKVSSTPIAHSEL